MRLLEGVRVLDFTRLLPGAYATLVLADLGAEVIKVEDPRGGDPARAMPPISLTGQSVYFEIINRNKKSVTLDLRSPEAPAIVDALAGIADVSVESFRPRTARRLGVDAATLRAQHPRLVCASITGFGQTGARVDRAAHDINYQALAGLLAIDGATPRVPGFLIGDVAAAWNATAGILAALYSRERTGTGAAVDVSIQSAALSWLMFPAARQLVGASAEVEGQHLDVAIWGRDACYNVYQTADGQYVALGALEPKFWQGFCERIGRPDLVAMQNAEPAVKAQVLAEVRALMATRTREEWLALFADLDVCLSTVQTVEQSIADPEFRECGAIAPLIASNQMPAYVTTPIAVTADTAPGAWQHARPIPVSPAPSLGRDTDAVLREAGLDDERRSLLRAAGVI
jgi:alpha-methylacyl-CoA racemase